MAEQNEHASTPGSAAPVMSPSTSKSANNAARMQRNVAEKQRRDKLNSYISQLANIVPMVSMSSRRLDKTSILRLSAAHLRICKSSLGGNRSKKNFKWCPSFLSTDQVRGILESVDGFLIVTTSNGKILFTSRSVERYLGHQDIDMIGHSLFTFIHPQDIESIKEELERLLVVMENSVSGSSRRCSFRCRMKEKGQPRSEVVTYQYVHFVGSMSVSEEDISSSDDVSKSVVTHMFKAFVKIVEASPYNQLSLEEATADEYVTRHSLDGTIIFADHRLATITGHMPHEVVGLSAYEYIHGEDTSIALFAHHLMFSSDKGTGMIVYRLRTRDDRYVYLKSVGCLQFDAVTSQVDHFVCVNQYLSATEGDKQLKYFIDRYIPHIKGSSTSSLFESVKALQNSKSKPDVQKRKNSGNVSTEDSIPSAKKIESYKPKVDMVACVEENHDSDGYKGNVHCKTDSQGGFARCAVNQAKNHSLALQRSLPDSKLNSASLESDPLGPGNTATAGRTNRDLSSSTSNNRYISVNDHNSVHADGTIHTVSDQSRSDPAENTLSRAVVLGNSHILTKGPNDSLYPHQAGAESVDVSSQSSFGNSSPLSEEDAVRVSDAHLHGGQLPRNGSRNGGASEDVHFADIHQARTEDISVCHPQGKDTFSSTRNGMHITEANPWYLLQQNMEPLNNNGARLFVEKHSVQHSLPMNQDEYAKESEMASCDADYMLKNSMWPERKSGSCDSKTETSSSSMDYCDDMSAAYDEVNGEMKHPLAFQEDLTSLLCSTLPNEDSSSSLPSANRWNDIFNPTECTSDLGCIPHSDFS